MPVGDDEIERLYGLPLEEFVRERDALAKRLRAEKRAEEAERVKKLEKPSQVAWAVNQLARARAGDFRAFLEAADRLREVQTSGEGDFAAAAAAEREAVRALVRAAGDVLRAAGRPASDATLDRIARTLHAAAAEETARPALERGTLTREVEPSGFGGLLGALAPSRRAARPVERPARTREQAKAREEAGRLAARAKELESEATAAEREAEQLRRAHERAERDAVRARERADEAARLAEEAAERLRDR